MDELFIFPQSPDCHSLCRIAETKNVGGVQSVIYCDITYFTVAATIASSATTWWNNPSTFRFRWSVLP